MVSAYEEEVKPVQGEDMEDVYDSSKPIAEYDDSINRIVYNALACHAACSCHQPVAKGEIVRRHFTRLRLVDKIQFCETEDAPKEAMFDVLYSSEPAQLGKTATWQQLRFLVSA